MLISVLIFECKPDRSHLLTPYLLKTSFQTRSCLKLFPIYLHHWIKTLRNHSF
ncbi:unknown [Prevotella sp. CAG:755]|nr:unknown [Prevotella sp. CAG:755]